MQDLRNEITILEKLGALSTLYRDGNKYAYKKGLRAEFFNGQVSFSWDMEQPDDLQFYIFPVIRNSFPSSMRDKIYTEESLENLSEEIRDMIMGKPITIELKEDVEKLVSQMIPLSIGYSLEFDNDKKEFTINVEKPF